MFPKKLSSLHLLNLLEDSLKIGWVEIPSAGDEWMASRGLRRLINFPPENAEVHHTIIQAVHIHERDEFTHNLALLFRGVVPPTRLFRMQSAGGSICQIMVQYHEILDAAGLTRFVLIMRNDSAWQASPQFHHELSRRLEVMMQAMEADVLWRANANLELIDYVVHGHLFQSTQVFGKGWMNLIPEKDRADFIALLLRAREEEKQFGTTVHLKGGDGKIRLYRLIGMPVVEADGTIAEWCGSVSEVVDSLSVQANEFAAVTNVEHLRGLVGGATLRAACAIVNWTYRDLALRSGLSVSTIARMATTDGLLINGFKVATVDTVLFILLESGANFEKSNGRLLISC